MFFVWFEMLFAALLCVALSVLVAVQRPAERLGSKIVKEMDEAEPSPPPMAVWEEGIKEMGKRAGEKAFSDNEEVTDLTKMRVGRFKVKPEKIGEGSQKAIDLFKKIFGE